MPIAISCPHCRATYQVKDELAGKPIRCKCAKVIRVPAKNPAANAIQAPTPAAVPVASAIRSTLPPVTAPALVDDVNRNRGRTIADDVDKRLRPGGPFPGLVWPPDRRLLIGVGAGVGAFLVLLITLALWPDSPSPQPPVASSKLPVQADRGPEKPPPPKVTAGVVVDTPFSRLIFTRTSTPFVAVRQRGPNQQTTYQIVDTVTRKKIAEYRTASDWGDVALSADGAMLAGRANRQGAIEVHTPQGVYQIGALPWYGIFFDFTATNKLLVVYQRGDWHAWLYKLFDPATGKEIAASEGPNEIRSSPYALSPDRQHFASVLHQAGVGIRKLDTLAEVRRLPLDLGIAGVAGLEFSPDGHFLAAFYEERFQPRIRCWNWQSGEVLHDYTLERRVRDRTQSMPLEWLPDGSAWVLNGKAVVDRNTGQELAELPSYPGETDRQRRFLDSNNLLVVKGQGDARSLEIVACARDARAAVVAKVDNPPAGNVPKPAVPNVAPKPPVESGLPLPALASGDRSALRDIVVPAGNPQWKVVVEGAASRVAAPNLAVKAAAGEVQDVLVGHDKAVVVGLVQNRIRLECFDLRASEALEALDLFQPSVPAGPQRFVSDLHLGSKSIALREPGEKKRVDVWTLPGGKHIIGLAPFGSEADPAVLWAGLAGDLLLTANGRRLIAWQLPQGKAIYSVAGPFAPDSFAFSPTRRQLAVLSGRRFLVLDTSTGEVAATLPLPAEVTAGRVATASFRPDGKALAALVARFDGGQAPLSLEQAQSLSARSMLIRWDLTRGAVEQTLTAPIVPGRLQWVGADHVLAGAFVVDWTSGDMLAEVSASFPDHYRPGYQGHDLRHWFVVGRTGGTTRLVCQSVPDDESLRLQQAIKDKSVEIVFGPDVPVDLAIEGSISEMAIEKLKQHLARQKHPVVAGSRLVLTVRLEEGSAPGIKVREIGAPLTPPPTPSFPNFPRPGGLGGGFPQMSQPSYTEVPGLSLLGEAILRDDQVELWKTSRKDQTSQGIGLIRADDLTAYFHKPVRDRMDAWVMTLVLPGGVVREGGQLIPYPRRIALTGD